MTDPLLELRSVTVKFGGNVAVADASLIADNAHVSRSATRPVTHRLVLAENSLVQLG